MATSISSANASLVLAVSGLFNVPQAIQGFDVDDAVEVDTVSTKEIKIGVDGLMSAGIIYNPVVLSIILQADSVSNAFFEQWYAQEQALQDALIATGMLRHQSVRKTYAILGAALDEYTAAAPMKRVLMPRRFTIKIQPPFVGVPF